MPDATSNMLAHSAFRSISQVRHQGDAWLVSASAALLDGYASPALAAASGLGCTAVGKRAGGSAEAAWRDAPAGDPAGGDLSTAPCHVAKNLQKISLQASALQRSTIVERKAIEDYDLLPSQSWPRFEPHVRPGRGRGITGGSEPRCVATVCGAWRAHGWGRCRV